MPDQLSPLLQSLTANVAQVAEMERRLSKTADDRDEYYQTAREQKARIEEYERIIAELQAEVERLKGDGEVVVKPPVTEGLDFVVHLGPATLRRMGEGERWKSERRWTFENVIPEVTVLVDVHDSGQVRVALERCSVTLPHTAPVLTLPLRVEIDGKVRHDAPIRLHHHCRPTLVFDRRPAPADYKDGKLASGVLATEILVPRFKRGARILETELAAIDAGSEDWARWPEIQGLVYDRVSEEYGQVRRSWTGGAGRLLNEAAMLAPIQVAYLLSRDTRAWAELIRLADSSGNYAIHYRLPDGRFPRADETADLPFLQGDPHVKLTTASGVTLPVPDVAHQHSLVYLAYLLTGERYYYEEMRAWWTYNLLTRPKTADRHQGIIWSGQVRASAWALRSLLHLVLAGDGDYEILLYRNLNWMRDTFTIPTSSHYRATGIPAVENWRPSGMLQFANTTAERQWTGTWMVHVMAYVLGECVRAGYEEAVPMRDHLLKVARACWEYAPSKFLAPWGNHIVPAWMGPVIDIERWWRESMTHTFANMPAAAPHRTSFADPLTPDYIGWFRAAVVTAVDAGHGPEWADEALKWLDEQIPKSRWKELPLVWRVEPARKGT
jgi:hypothetical protein